MGDFQCFYQQKLTDTGEGGESEHANSDRQRVLSAVEGSLRAELLVALGRWEAARETVDRLLEWDSGDPTGQALLAKLGASPGQP